MNTVLVLSCVSSQLILLDPYSVFAETASMALKQSYNSNEIILNDIGKVGY